MTKLLALFAMVAIFQLASAATVDRIEAFIDTIPTKEDIETGFDQASEIVKTIQAQAQPAGEIMADVGAVVEQIVASGKERVQNVVADIIEEVKNMEEFQNAADKAQQIVDDITNIMPTPAHE